jgi:hypothetical protein
MSRREAGERLFFLTHSPGLPATQDDTEIRCPDLAGPRTLRSPHMKKLPYSSLALAAVLATGLAFPANAQSRPSPNLDVSPLLQRDSPLARSASIPGASCEGGYFPDWWKLIQPETYGPSMSGPSIAMRWPAGSSPLEMAGEFLVGPSVPGSLGVLLVGNRRSLTSRGLLLGGISQAVLVRFDATGLGKVPISLRAVSCLRGTGVRFAVQCVVPTSSGSVMSRGLEIKIR